MNEKQVSYQFTNSYTTLNDYTSETKNVWIVFHGIGYLSRYFLKYFKDLNKEENYIIAPQAPSKYYLNGEYKHVGASWATREETAMEMENAMNYLEEIYRNENLADAPNLILLGYSQGVSVVTRWVARKKLRCSKIILNSGRIPKELEPSDFAFLENTEIAFVYGKEDPFVNQEFLESEEKRIRELFPKNLQFIGFEGGHEVNKEVISKFAQKEQPQ